MEEEKTELDINLLVSSKFINKFTLDVQFGNYSWPLFFSLQRFTLNLCMEEHGGNFE